MNIRITAGNFTELLGETSLDMFSNEMAMSEEATSIDSSFLEAHIGNLRNRDMSVCTQSYRPSRDLEIASDQGHPRLSISLLLEGEFRYRWDGMAREASCRQGTMQIWAGELPGYCRFAAGTTSQMLSVTASEECLQRLGAASGAIQELLNPVDGAHPYRMLPPDLPIHPGIRSAIRSMKDCDFLGNAAGTYRDAKFLEIFALLLNVRAEGANRRTHPCLRSYDAECLREARDILLRRVLDPPTISELSQLAGINECKLKKGFRTLFGNSVYGLLFEHRMELARRYLLDTEKSVQEIAGLCGYEHVSHFSTAFRRGTGTSPAAFRRNRLQPAPSWNPPGIE